jgi:hypothetical protein
LRRKVFYGAAAHHLLLPEQPTGAVNSVPTQRRGWECAPMKQKVAREQILQQWDRWILNQTVEPGGPTGKDSLKFFIELQDAKSPLLDFPSRGRDKWRIIHTWLLTAQRVSDHWVVPAPPIVPTRRPRAARQRTGCKT